MLFANEVIARSMNVTTEQRQLWAVVTGLVLYNASVLAEVVRAGILALPKGQTEAAQAIGLRKGQTMSSILLPQAVTVMLPAIVSQLVVIVKDTALGGVMIGFTELLSGRATLAAVYANVVPSFVVVAIIYIVLNFIITSFASWLSSGCGGARSRPERSSRPRLSGARRPPVGRAAVCPASAPTSRRRTPDDRSGDIRPGCPPIRSPEGSGMIATALRHLTQAPAMGCIRSVIVHPAPTSCSPTSAGTSRRAGGAAPWIR